jgi:hypothetical protein
LEDWKIGRLEDWKIGRLEDYKIKISRDARETYNTMRYSVLA